MKSKNTLVYVGPSIEHIVQEGEAFRGGIPQCLEKIIVQEPFLRDLIVPANELAETKKAIRNQTSRLNMLYRKARKIGENYGI